MPASPVDFALAALRIGGGGGPDFFVADVFGAVPLAAGFAAGVGPALAGTGAGRGGGFGDSVTGDSARYGDDATSGSVARAEYY